MALAGQSPLDAYLGRFEAEFPFGAEVRRLFARATAMITYARSVTRDAPPRTWELHVRLPPRVEDRFGISRQFLVYCLAASDLQPRDVTRLKSLVETALHPIEPDLAMLITCDPMAKEKLIDWGAERMAGMILIPLYRGQLAELLAAEDGYTALPELIGGWISAYNLYDQREPVTGERFFGRADLLRDLDRKLAQGSGHVGIFGLRRIGKTSVLLEVNDRLRTRANVVPIFLDLEASTVTAHVGYRIGEELAKALARHSTALSERAARRVLRLPDHWEDLAPQTLITNVGDNLRNALSGGVLQGMRLVLILDEAEVLVPDVAAPREHALDLFRVLRGVAQETRSLTLVLAGVNATPAETPFLGSEDNPLFGLLSVEYLGPLTDDECMQMIRRVGRKMQVRWDPPALLALTSEVGAHPLLARLAASDVVTAYPERPLRPNTQHVSAVMREFDRRNSPIFTQMVQSLRRYYPDEFDLLRLVAAGELDFAAEFAQQNPAILNHLSGYGVLRRAPLRIGIPVFERWLKLHST
jgi:hypothetical protein